METLALLVLCSLFGIGLRLSGRLPDNLPAGLNGFIIHISLPALILVHVHRLPCNGPSRISTTSGRLPSDLLSAGWWQRWPTPTSRRSNPVYEPYRIRRQDLEPFAFAGLWERARIGGEDIVSTAIIVCGANERVMPLHDRIPVILEPADYDAWLDPATPVPEAHALLRTCPAEMLEAYPVSRIVNSPRNYVPECIEPLAQERADG